MAKRKRRVPATRSIRPATQSTADDFYGPDVSGVIRVDDFPTEPSSFIVQQQYVRAGGVSGWHSIAVYRSHELAELFVARWGGGSTLGTTSRADEFVRDAEQPIIEYRIATLDDLAREGMDALGLAVLWLMESDHEWLISTEIGQEATIALIADHMSGRIG